MQEMGWQLQRGPTVKRTDRQTAECVKPEQDGRNSYMQLYRRQTTGEDGRVKWHHIAYTCLHMTEDLLKTVGLQYILSQVIAEYSNARRIVSILDKPIFTSTISIQPRAAESAKFTLGALESVVCPCHGAIEIVVVIIIIIIIIIIRMLGDIDHPDSRATTTRATWWRWSPEHSLYFMYRVRHKKNNPWFHEDVRPCLHHVACDYCNAILAGSQRCITDKLQRLLNAAARLVTATRKFDHGLSLLLHDDLHWLDIPERVHYKLRVTVHRCLHDKAPSPDFKVRPSFDAEYLQNGCRYGHSYYGRRIGNRTQAFKWYYFQWPWVTFNLDLKVTV